MTTNHTPYGWVREKPEPYIECILITASFISNRYWDYNLFEITRIEVEEGWYWGILKDGEEWGDIGDLKADLYKVLPILANPNA